MAWVGPRRTREGDRGEARVESLDRVVLQRPVDLGPARILTRTVERAEGEGGNEETPVHDGRRTSTFRAVYHEPRKQADSRGRGRLVSDLT